MIAFLLALAAAVPPAPSGQPLPPGPVEVVNPIANAVAQPGAEVGPADGGAEPPVVRAAVKTASLRIPDEIAPAVVPYMGCLLARDGVEVRGKIDPRPPGVSKGADCAPFRKRAAKDAHVLLKRQGMRSRAERTAFIERTLTSIENFPKPGATPPTDSEPHAKN